MCSAFLFMRKMPFYTANIGFLSQLGKDNFKLNLQTQYGKNAHFAPLKSCANSFFFGLPRCPAATRLKRAAGRAMRGVPPSPHWGRMLIRPYYPSGWIWRVPAKGAGTQYLLFYLRTLCRALACKGSFAHIAYKGSVQPAQPRPLRGCPPA